MIKRATGVRVLCVACLSAALNGCGEKKEDAGTGPDKAPATARGEDANKALVGYWELDEEATQKAKAGGAKRAPGPVTMEFTSDGSGLFGLGGPAGPGRWRVTSKSGARYTVEVTERGVKST
jgi:hypothetical protein